MARPDPHGPWQSFEQHALAQQVDLRVPVFPLRSGGHTAAERVGHQLHAIADAERGWAHLQHRRVDARGAGVGHAARAARQDQPDGLTPRDLFGRRAEWQDFRIHAELAQPTRNQLRVLRTEIEDDNRLMGHADGPEPVKQS